jgi:hypothetical protein
MKERASEYKKEVTTNQLNQSDALSDGL